MKQLTLTGVTTTTDRHPDIAIHLKCFFCMYNFKSLATYSKIAYLKYNFYNDKPICTRCRKELK